MARPHFDGHATVCHLVKHRNRGAFCHENAARSPNCGRFGKKCQNSIPAQIQRQTIKVWHIFLSKSVAQILQIVAFFLTRTVCAFTQCQESCHSLTYFGHPCTTQNMHCLALILNVAVIHVCTSSQQLLSDQVGVVNFSPYKSLFLLMFSHSRTAITGIPLLPPLFGYPLRNWSVDRDNFSAIVFL